MCVIWLWDAGAVGVYLFACYRYRMMCGKPWSLLCLLCDIIWKRVAFFMCCVVFRLFEKLNRFRYCWLACGKVDLKMENKSGLGLLLRCAAAAFWYWYRLQMRTLRGYVSSLSDLRERERKREKKGKQRKREKERVRWNWLWPKRKRIGQTGFGIPFDCTVWRVRLFTFGKGDPSNVW